MEAKIVSETSSASRRCDTEEVFKDGAEMNKGGDVVSEGKVSEADPDKGRDAAESVKVMIVR
jgi:hypothetical protein